MSTTKDTLQEATMLSDKQAIIKYLTEQVPYDKAAWSLLADIYEEEGSQYIHKAIRLMLLFDKLPRRNLYNKNPSYTQTKADFHYYWVWVEGHTWAYEGVVPLLLYKSIKQKEDRTEQTLDVLLEITGEALGRILRIMF
jgi:hypothetical protein